MRNALPTEIETLSGKYFDLANPHASIVDIYDIAGSLAKICRFTGHTKDFYSVAQHSVHVSYLAPEEFALEALLHDAHEAYTGDMSTPMKRLVELMGGHNIMKKIESNITDAIMCEFGIFDWNPEMWHAADLRALATEKLNQMRPSPEVNWSVLDGVEVDSDWLMSSAIWHYQDAEVYFLSRFNELLEVTRDE